MVNIEKLLPGAVIHVFGRTNGRDKLFYTEANYKYFLDKYKFHISPMVETLCYFLHINHFHFIIRVKEKTELDLDHHSFTKKQKTLISNSAPNDEPESIATVASQHFSNFLNGYAQAINKQEDRHGNLIQRPFKRKLLSDERYLRTCIMYIHSNPIKSKLDRNLESSRHSSYPELITSQPTWLDRDSLLLYFGGVENMITAHKEYLITR
ncbi:hypothetical protein G3O08_19965 [Cryomorpha ignava]|uniref:Transposase IS200-like domain-containing protein n=2 Tax=Cryomorpha ignava TaxID=101383 RepID=A0A7K3WXE9_9FLAO|nr:hypothetical protein [Cryomorpha ignava]